MNKITKLIKQEIKNRGGKIRRKKRIIIGRILFIYAALPIFSAWAFVIAIPLMMPISPTLWAKDKIRYVKEWVSMR